MSQNSPLQNTGSIRKDYEKAGTSGKPKKSGKKKYPRVALRLSEDELARLKKLCDSMTYSAYIRKCLFGKHATPRKVRSRSPVKDEEALAQVLGLLGQSRIANNLNQLAHEANCGTLLLDEQAYNELNEAYVHICFMRTELIRALGLSDCAGAS